MTRPFATLASLLLLAALPACTCGSPTGTPSADGVLRAGPRPEGTPPAWKGEGLPAASNARVIQLDRTAATWTFPASNLPAGVDPSAPFKLSGAKERQGGWTFTLPFKVHTKKKNPGAPPGMKVLADGVELTFSKADLIGKPTVPNTWSASEAELSVFLPQAPREVTVTHAGLAGAANRLNRSRAGDMNDDAFAHYTFTLGAHTREGLLLPAPGTATWTAVEVPEGARLETSLALIPFDLLPASDGAEAVVLARVDGQERELGRVKLSPGGEDFSTWSVNLDAVAGRKVDLLLRTEPGASPTNDYVFFGSPAVVGKPSGDVRRVFVIGIDTTRPDHFSVNGYPRDTTPELDAWSKDAVIFDRAWTSAPRTRPSFRAATTGRLPLDAVCAPNIGQVFDERGFATAGIVANVHLNPYFDFQKGFDLWWLDGKAQVNDQISRAIDWLDENKDRDTYMFLHVMDPHIFYKAPDPYGDKYTATLPPLAGEEQIPKMFNRWQVYKWQQAGKLTDLRKQHITAMYDGELAWTSHELSRFLEHIEGLPGKSLVIIHNDHGEEFWEHDGFEHNHTLYNDTTLGLLWVKPPGGTGQAGARSEHPATLQDIGPTAYEFAGFTDAPKTDGVSLLPAIRGAADAGWTRPIPIGHLQYGASQFAVVWEDHKYIVTTGTGAEELYDLRADVAEKVNLAPKEDTGPWLRRLLDAHRFDGGPGWRIQVKLDKRGPVSITLPAKARLAGVLDPELISKKPANQEWGEVPKKVPADVAEDVVLSDDGRTLTFKPGRQGTGTVYVVFDAPTPASGTSAKQADQEGAANNKGVITLGETTLTISPGSVVLPTASEWERMQACMNNRNVGSDVLSELEALGYIHND
jgi:arylsulfatase A-like enzyme